MALVFAVVLRRWPPPTARSVDAPADVFSAGRAMATVAELLENARIFEAEGPFRNPIIFLLTPAEEVGLTGAQAFVDQRPWAMDVGAAINAEARGTSGQSAMAVAPALNLCGPQAVRHTWNRA